MSGASAVGFVGLGNMGSVLAANLVGAGLPVVAHDVAGPERAPAGADFASELAQVARRAHTVVFSLPNGDISEQVARGLARARSAASDTWWTPPRSG